MGLFEDAQAQAQRETAAQNAAQDRARSAANDAYTTQTRAVAEFIEGMQRLGIQPRRHKFFSCEWVSTLKSVNGWDTSYPREPPHRGWRARHVISTSGEVFNMNTKPPSGPCDLSKLVSVGLQYESDIYLAAGLRNSLANAIRGN